MKPRASARQIRNLVREVETLGFKPHLSRGEETTIIGLIGDERKLDPAHIQTFPGVERVIPILKPYKMASRDFRGRESVVVVDHVTIGMAHRFTVMAGPCAVESYEQTLAAAKAVKAAGARILRGGAYKPRSSPYAFQGLGPQGLEILAAVRGKTGLPVVTEVVALADVGRIADAADILQVGARNMQNFPLLEELGRVHKPILLKRGLSSTIEEWLLSAEYILSRGNPDVILCERGIRTFEKATRNTLDISAVPVIKRLSHLPIVVDPTHACGERLYAPALAKAALAVGADGLLVEVHPHPDKALCDGPESLTPEQFAKLMGELRAIAKAVGRTL